MFKNIKAFTVYAETTESGKLFQTEIILFVKKNLGVSNRTRYSYRPMLNLWLLESYSVIALNGDSPLSQKAAIANVAIAM